MPAGDVMTAVNVRNELNNKFADLIVSGQKSIETRRSRSLDNLIGNRVKIVRTTGKGDEARVIGEVTIGEPIQYKTRAEFAKDYDKHLVDEDSDFAFQDGGKFGYPMINPERYETPYPMPKRKGIVYTKEVGGPNKLFMPASEAGAGKGKQAEAAKLWNEKGTDSPYFKKWFGKSKVVDENGEPLVVYHGTSDKFTAFDADRYQSINKGDFGEGFYFTPKKGQAKLYSQDAIKKTDPEVLALQKEYEAQAKQLGTSTMMAAIDLGLNSPEYKKLQQFENRLDQKLQSINKGNDEIIIDSYLSLENPLIVKSTSASDPFLAQSAKERGHDGIIVKFDNGRFDEIVAFSPEQIKSATGNRGTFESGERNINYMPSDPKAPTRQPANRITRQAPAMPGNRFMAPAVSAGAKSAERFR